MGWEVIYCEFTSVNELSNPRAAYRVFRPSHPIIGIHSIFHSTHHYLLWCEGPVQVTFWWHWVLDSSPSSCRLCPSCLGSCVVCVCVGVCPQSCQSNCSCLSPQRISSIRLNHLISMTYSRTFLSPEHSLSQEFLCVRCGVVRRLVLKPVIPRLPQLSSLGSNASVYVAVVLSYTEGMGWGISSLTS